MSRPMHIWTEQELSILTCEYPVIGLHACARRLGLRPAQVRTKASKMGVRQNRESEFFKEWQTRAAASKIGRKRPEQALVINKTKAEGRLVVTDEGRARIGAAARERLARQGHPRGALGMRHTDATKARLSETSKAMWVRMSEEEKDRRAMVTSLLGRKTAMNRLNATWKAAWRDFGGKRVFYRSRWEANYGRYLQWLKEAGEIAEWEHEPRTFWFEGIKRGCMSYLPDFRVTEKSGAVVYHEVKGWMDDRSKTKIKRMAKYHPNVKLIVIEEKAYKAIERSVKAFVPGWES